MSVNTGTAGGTSAVAATNDFVMTDADGSAPLTDAKVNDKADKSAVDTGADKTVEGKEAKDKPEGQSKAQDEDDQGETAEEGDKPKKKSGYQRKIDKLQREIEEMRKSMVKPAVAEPTKTTKAEAPKVGDFENYDEYTQAVVEHRAKETVEKLLKERDEADQRAKVKKAFEDKIAAYEAAKTKFRDATPDFDEVVESYDGPPLNQHVEYAILESDIAAEITYYLGKHPEETAAIAGMGFAGANRAIGAIEAKLKYMAELKAADAAKTSETQEGAKAKVKTTSAPEPIKPLGGNKAAGSDSKTLETAAEESFAEYERLRRKK